MKSIYIDTTKSFDEYIYEHNRAEFTTVDIITERLNIRLLETMRCGMDGGTDFEGRLIGGVTKRCLVFPSC